MIGKKFTTTRIGDCEAPYYKKPASLRWSRFSESRKGLKRKIVIFLLGAPLVAGALFLMAIIYFSIGLPDVRNLDQYRVSQSTFIYDRNGKELYAIHGDENRESIEVFDKTGKTYEKGDCFKERDLCALSEGYRYAVLATIAIEDDRFYSHHGFDAERLVKAVFSQFLPTVKSRGGSTITQQYIKNTLLTPEKSLSRKIRELILAVKIENVLSKEEIMELYLNRIPYGSNAYGIELAAKTYFNKEAKDLTLAEAAILAALPNAPTRYSPYGNYRYTKILKTFTEKELERNPLDAESDLDQDEFVRGLLGTVIDLTALAPAEQGVAVPTEQSEVVSPSPDAESIGATPESPKRLTLENTDLKENVIYVKGRTDLVLQRMYDLGYITEDEKKSALEESWDKEFLRARENILAPHFVLYIREMIEEKYGKEVVEQGGLKVYTTLDYDLQKFAEDAIAARKDTFKETHDASNAALVSMDRETGEVLALVGSADYFDEEIDGSVNMAMSYVQPGSSFKPIVYGLAFTRGMLQPATVLYDVETKFGGHTHVAQNYDGTFTGQMSVRRALGQSRNIPAIKAYYLAGEQELIVPFAQSLGVEFLDPTTEHGSSLALGSAELKFFSLVEAYRTISNYGIKTEPRFILKVENNKGEILEEWKAEPKESQIAFGEVKELSENTLTATETAAEQSPASSSQEATTPQISGESIPTITLDPQAAYLITDILADPGPRLGPNLTIPGWQNAAKTGTSNKRVINNPDNENDDQIFPSNLLTFGYTNELVTGVWVGNSDGAVMKRTADGYNLAAPIWKEFMIKALEKKVPSYFSIPSGITKVKISKSSGLLPNVETTPAEMITEDLFASYAIPEVVEDKFTKIAIDKKTKKLWTENCPLQNKIEKAFEVHKELFPQYTDWQEGVDEWAKKQDILIPEEKCDDDYKREFDALPTVQILAPFNHGEVPYKPFKVYAFASSPNGIANVEFYLGDMLQYQTKTAPYIGNIRPPATAGAGAKRTIIVRAYDKYGFSTDASAEIRFDPTLDKIQKPAEYDALYTTGRIASPDPASPSQ